MALHEFVIENKSHGTQKQHAGRTHKIAADNSVTKASSMNYRNESG